MKCHLKSNSQVPIAFAAFLFFIHFSFKIIAAPAINFTENHHFTVVVIYSEAKSNDTLDLAIANPLFLSGTDGDWGYFRVAGKNKRFVFNISTPFQYGYFDILKNRRGSAQGSPSDKMWLLRKQFWEAGDSVIINLSNKETAYGINSKYDFHGKDRFKYKLRQRLDSMYLQLEDTARVFDKDFNFHNPGQQLINKKLSIIHSEKSQLSKAAYYALLTDMSYFNTSYVFNIPVRSFYEKYILNANVSIKKKFNLAYNSQFGKIIPDQIPLDFLALSNTSLRAIISELKSSAYIYTGNESNTKWIYNLLKKTTSGILQERLVVYMMLNFKRDNNTDEIARDALSYFKNAECRQLVERIVSTGAGNHLTDGIFQNIQGETVSISDFKGKVLLLDFWYNGCGYCRQLYKEVISKLEDHFKSDDFKVVSINIDKSKDLWKKGIASNGYSGDGAINLNTNGLGASHPFIVNNRIGHYPYLILIDKQGVIKANNDINLRNLDSLSYLITKLL